MTESVDTLVIGAGVVGLAIARQQALAGHEVLIIEAEGDIGTQTSSRNSEVIHAGIYYPAASLKAALCVRGQDLLYDFCARNGVTVKRLGKLIVATRTEEEAKLDAILAQAKANGVNDLRRLSRAKALAMEPEVECTAALVSPSTGIVDSRAFMLALLGEAEAHGASLALRTTLQSAAPRADGFHVQLIADGEAFDLSCRRLVNAAGHGAHGVALGIADFPPQHVPPRHLAKGSYCSVSGASPFQRLIYPLPVPGGLGIHATLDMQGRVRLGPDVRWVDSEDYGTADVDPEAFRNACLSYWPGLKGRDVTPAYCGVRPKISGPGEPPADFRIDGPARHGIAGLVNLFGIESPGLTSSLAIAEHVAALLEQ